VSFGLGVLPVLRRHRLNVRRTPGLGTLVAHDSLRGVLGSGISCLGAWCISFLGAGGLDIIWLARQAAVITFDPGRLPLDPLAYVVVSSRPCLLFRLVRFLLINLADPNSFALLVLLRFQLLQRLST
jgi:hypothetical protein